MKKITLCFLTLSILASGAICAASKTPFNPDFTIYTNDSNTFVVNSETDVNYDYLGMPSGEYNILYSDYDTYYKTQKSTNTLKHEEYKNAYLKLDNNDGFFDLNDVEFYLEYENHTQEIPRELISVTPTKWGGYPFYCLEYNGIKLYMVNNVDDGNFDFFNDIQTVYELGEEFNFNNSYAIINNIRISPDNFRIDNYNPNLLGPQVVCIYFSDYVYYQVVCVTNDITKVDAEYIIDYHRNEPYEISNRGYGNSFTAFVPGTLEYTIGDKEIMIELGINEQYIINENALFNYKFRSIYGEEYNGFIYNILKHSSNPIVYHVSDDFEIVNLSGDIISPINGIYELNENWYNIKFNSVFSGSFNEIISIAENGVDHHGNIDISIDDKIYYFSDVELEGSTNMIKDYEIIVNGQRYDDVLFGDNLFTINGDYEIKIIYLDGNEEIIEFKLQYTVNITAFFTVLGIGVAVLVGIPLLRNKNNKDRMNKEIQ